MTPALVPRECGISCLLLCKSCSRTLCLEAMIAFTLLWNPEPELGSQGQLTSTALGISWSC